MLIQLITNILQCLVITSHGGFGRLLTYETDKPAVRRMVGRRREQCIVNTPDDGRPSESTASPHTAGKSRQKGGR